MGGGQQAAPVALLRCALMDSCRGGDPILAAVVAYRDKLLASNYWYLNLELEACERLISRLESEPWPRLGARPQAARAPEISIRLAS